VPQASGLEARQMTKFGEGLSSDERMRGYTMPRRGVARVSCLARGWGKGLIT
jgi:hypothetical protein